MKIELLQDLKIYKDDRSFTNHKKGDVVEIDENNGLSLIASKFAKSLIEEVKIDKVEEVLKIEKKKFDEVIENKSLEKSPENKSFSSSISKKKK